MDIPGYDVISIIGTMVGGANMLCFTIGRGTVMGSISAPGLNMASNSGMYRYRIEDMDVNCGIILDGEADIAKMRRLIFERVLEAASGKTTKSDAEGFGQLNFAP
jgi:altronate hydrolase